MRVEQGMFSARRDAPNLSDFDGGNEGVGSEMLTS